MVYSSKKQISESRVWVENHKSLCPAQYSEFASVQLESALALAPVVIRQAYDRGIIFAGLVCDGDNKTIEALKDARVYHQLGEDLNINRLECLSL